MKVPCFNGTVREARVQTVTDLTPTWGNAQYQYPGVSRINPLGFKATLNAFVADGTAEVLSNPTILVLDGRQALIRIGTQIPNEQTTATNGYVSTTVNYINTGIVLNIRPLAFPRMVPRLRCKPRPS